MYAFPCFLDAVLISLCPYGLLSYVEDLREISVGETVELSLKENGLSGNLTLILHKSFFLFNKFLHLLKEPVLDLRYFVDLFYRSALTECLVDDELSLGSGSIEHHHKIFLALVMEVLGESEAVSSCLKRSYSLLESFLICLTDAHYLTYGTHLCTELVLSTLELLESPSCELDYNVVSVGYVLIESTVLTAGDLIKCKTACEHSGYQSDGESRCLGSKSRGS